MSIREKLLQRPDVEAIIQSIQKQLADESIRRHDFLQWVDESVKAEFINGEVILHSPVKARHLNVTDLLSRIMSFHCSFNQLGRVFVEKAMVHLTRNDYEPDIIFYRKEISDTFADDLMLFPAPDLVVEILSKRTAKRDRGIKFEDYASHQIPEYWIIDPEKEFVELYFLSVDKTAYILSGKYQGEAIIKSRAMPGFMIPSEAIFDEQANTLALKELMG
jgi:Uma2 family endonuclease